jgi:hypothetical protein
MSLTNGGYSFLAALKSFSYRRLSSTKPISNSALRDATAHSQTVGCNASMKKNENMKSILGLITGNK